MGNTNNPFSDQYGFRVVEIKDGSPAHKSGLQISTDYIMCFNGRNLNEMETHEITRAVAVCG
jgi:S1-C subfamily serine protease